MPLTLKSATAQYRLMRVISRLFRTIIMAEHYNHAQARRAAVLADPALRRAAFEFIGLSAVLSWEASWVRRKQPINRRDYPAGRAASSAPKAPRTAVYYALMPLPTRDYGYRRAARAPSPIRVLAPVSAPPEYAIPPLPPAYLFPHEICPRPAIWDKRHHIYDPNDERYNPPRRTAYRDNTSPDETPPKHGCAKGQKNHNPHNYHPANYQWAKA